MKDLYKQVHDGQGQLVVAPTKEQRDKAISLLHAMAKKNGVRVRTQKISPTRFYINKVVR